MTSAFAFMKVNESITVVSNRVTILLFIHPASKCCHIKYCSAAPTVYEKAFATREKTNGRLKHCPYFL